MRRELVDSIMDEGRVWDVWRLGLFSFLKEMFADCLLEAFVDCRKFRGLKELLELFK
jgi:hypothetical protein